MTDFQVQIEQICFERNDETGTDGYVIYLITTPCTERPCRHICLTHAEREHCYERQLFRRGEFGHRLNATAEEKETNCANVWGWDGNLDAPSLTPSFLAAGTRPYRMHSYLREGRLELCGDSTVSLHPAPSGCVDKPYLGKISDD